MSSHLVLDTVLSKAAKQEEKREWMKAARSYEQALDLGSKIGHTWERIGFCYGRASRQATEPEEFIRIQHLAVNAYVNAAKSLTEDGLRNKSRSMRCSAIAEYLSSWLASSPLEKRKRLEECRLLGKRSLRAYEEDEDEVGYGKMCNDLLVCLFESLYAASDWEEMRDLMEEGLIYADKAIAIFSKYDDKNELLRGYSIGSLQCWYSANICEQEDRRRELAEKSLMYSERALRLSEDVDNPYDVAMSNWAAAFSTLFFTKKVESSLEYAYQMLTQGNTVEDNYLKGVATYVVAFVLNWMAPREDDPEKKKELYEKTAKHAEDAVQYLRFVCQDLFAAEAYWVYAESYSSLSRDLEVNSERKLAMLKKAERVGRKGLVHAKSSGSLDALGSTLHALSKALHFHSDIEKRKADKLRLLEEALAHRREYNKIVQRAFPHNDWICGVGKNYEGQIKTDLAVLESAKGKRISLLENAISDLEEGVTKCRKTLLSRSVPTLLIAVGKFEEWLAASLEELYRLTQDRKFLDKTIEYYKSSAQKFKVADLPSRAAESQWKIARNQARLYRHEKAAQSFESASKEYRKAAKGTPHIADFYIDYALYMKAWSEIERAISAHKEEEYHKATGHYERAADLLEQSKLWRHMSSDFLAWSQLEKAEALSREEVAFESIETFDKAATLFGEARAALQTKLDSIENGEERDLVKKLVGSSGVRREYCLGRIALEEARILDRQGDHLGSSRKYGSAAKTFERALDTAGLETDRAELGPIASLCRAWQLMTEAEANAQPELYLKASRFFDEAKELSTGEKAKLLALGHSFLCKSLRAGTRFEANRDKETYRTAKSHMEVAESYYLKAGLRHASEYARATNMLFDAYAYIHRAETEMGPMKKTQYLEMAERLLQTSAGCYMKAKHPEKDKQVRRLLESIKTKRQITISLAEVLHSATVASSTASISTPLSTYEEAVGLERFERAEIHANLSLDPQEATIGEEIGLRLDLVNTGNQPALLVRVNNLVPPSLRVCSVHPSHYSITDGLIDMKGRKIDPLKVESIEMRIDATRTGIASLSPDITYVSEIGEFRRVRPQPASVTIHPQLAFEFRTEAAQKAFNLLSDAFVQDYMRRKLPLERSGWRTLMQIVRQGKVPKSSVYGPAGRRGRAISELETRGLVETRIFQGERGRGGNIVKARVFYEKETIKRHIDRRTMKNREK